MYSFLYFILGVLFSAIILFFIYEKNKRSLVKREVEKMFGAERDMSVADKVMAVIECNEEEFGEMIYEGVGIFFNPSTQMAYSNDCEVVPERIDNFFSDLSCKVQDEQEYY